MVALLWVAYYVRIRQLHHTWDMTLEARVGERTRIARELHDTLLQSFHGLLLRFQAVSYLLPNRPIEAKERLDEAIARAGEAIQAPGDGAAGRTDITTAESRALSVSLLAVRSRSAIS